MGEIENLVNEEEKQKAKEKMRRFMDVDLRLKTIHEMRWTLLGHSEEIHDHDVYVEGMELLNEVERKVWQYINGEIDMY